jgi:uncharacterized protein
MKYNSFLRYILSKLQISYFLLAVFVLSIFTIAAQNNTLPKKPRLETSVYDDASLLSAYEKSSLEQKLINYADSTSTQIVVYTVTSLNGRNINLFAAEWAHKWGIGQADKDNGVLFLIAKEDRKMAIQVGYGLEHLLTDAMSRRIIEIIIAPHFKQGDYYSGIDAGTTSMMEVLSGEYVNDSSEEESGIPIIFFILFFVILFIILSKAKKNSGRGGGYRTVGTGPIILSRSGRSGGFGSGGFGGGSFGGGGFSGGFGGGGFGGGGASGGW